MKKRFKGLSVLLSIIMVFCLFAPYSFADETSEPGSGTTPAVIEQGGGEGGELGEGEGGDLGGGEGGDLGGGEGGELGGREGGELGGEIGDGMSKRGSSVMSKGLLDKTLNITINPSGAGTTKPSEGKSYFFVGSLVNITATPNTAGNYVFSHWSGDTGLNDPNNSNITVSMIYNHSLTANFKKVFTINAVSSNTSMGTVSPATKIFDDGKDVNISNNFTAQPKSGCEFVRWEMDGSPVTSVKADANKTITAVFKLKTYTLTASVNDPDRGTVTPNTGSYDGGSEVTVTAIANPGYKLVGWNYSKESAEGANIYTPNNDIIKVLMKGDILSKSVTAVFEPDAYTIAASVSKADNGDDMGSISASPASDTYGNGQVVTLTATPTGNGYVFHHWDFTQEYYSGSGKVYNDSNIFNSKITLTMRGEETTKSVKAVFEQIKYSVDAYVACDDAGGNLVITDEAGAVSPQREEWYSLIKEIFDFDSTLVPKITITATANYGYEFVRWHYTQEKFLGLFNVYEEKSDGTITVRMFGLNLAKKVTAVFAPIPNNAPVAVDQNYVTAKNTELTVDVSTGLLSGASDIDGQALSAALVTDSMNGPYNGSLTLNADGSFTYTPGQDFVGEDYFEFSVTDAIASVSAFAYIKVGVPNVGIEKIVDKQNAYAGESVKYTVTVTNTGDTTLGNIIVYDNLMNKSWGLANLEPLSSSVITYNYTIPTNMQVNDKIINTATVYAIEHNNTAYRLFSESQDSNIDWEEDGNMAEIEYGIDTFDVISSISATVTIIERPRQQSSGNSTSVVTYTLRTSVIGEGTVSPGTGTHSYSSGSTVQLSATPAEGWEFEGWQGDTVDASGKIVMNGDKSVTAVFSLIEVEEEMEDEPTPEAPAAEPQDDEILDDEETPAAPVDELPKTGGVPAGILYGLGGLIAAIGVAFGSKTKKKED